MFPGSDVVTVAAGGAAVAATRPASGGRWSGRPLSFQSGRC